MGSENRDTELNAKSFVSRIADSDRGTGSTGYREVSDKAQAVREQSCIRRVLFPGLLTRIKILLTRMKEVLQGVQGSGRFLMIGLRQ